MPSCHTHAFDFPFEFDAELRLDPRPHIFAERFDIRGTCVARIDEEVAVLLRYLRRAMLQSATAGFVDQLPCLSPGRFSGIGVLEGRTACARFDRLGGFARID